MYFLFPILINEQISMYSVKYLCKKLRMIYMQFHSNQQERRDTLLFREAGERGLTIVVRFETFFIGSSNYLWNTKLF